MQAPFPSGEGCRRSGGVVFLWRPRSGGCFSPWLSQILSITLPLPLGEVSCVSMTERA
ncbi:MAG: hypothetical protein FWH14_08015 [Oscillospiraceae bacterium]|nr:hypothetical protein [Oscillospiraceae bacterium]